MVWLTQQRRRYDVRASRNSGQMLRGALVGSLVIDLGSVLERWDGVIGADDCYGP